MSTLALPGNHSRSHWRSALQALARGIAGVSALLVVTLLAGCASTPQASPDRDSEAKQFSTHPASSTLYVYRPYFDSPDMDTVLWINGRLIGATLPGAYFRVNLDPGKHTLSGMGYDNGTFTLETRPGELYFVSLQVLGGHSRFQLTPPELGRKAIGRCCALLENWAPGQRPLLR